MHNVLIIHTHGGMGDLILSSVLAEAVKNCHPQSRVTFWASPRFAALLENHPFIDSCLDLDPGAPFSARLQTIRSHRFDAVLIPWSNSSHAWLAFLAGIPIRAGQSGRLTYSFLFTHPVRVRSVHGDTTSHWTEVQLDYVRSVGCSVPAATLTPKVILTSSEINQAIAVYQSFGLDPSRPVCGLQICKGLAVDEKRWPLDRFVDIGNQLVEKGWTVVLTGTGKEKQLIDHVAQRMAKPAPCLINLAGRYSLRETAALISRMNAFICPDTGPGHLAAALGVPVVSIFALKCDFPDRWRPIGAPYAIVRPIRRECEGPCIKETCPRLSCLLHIDPAEVVAAVSRFIAKPTSVETRPGPCIPSSPPPSPASPHRTG